MIFPLSPLSPLGQRVTERSLTTTTRPAAGTSVRSISSTRAPPMEDIASSQRNLCSPSGPRLTPSSSSTPRGSCRDPGWTSMEIPYHHHRHHRSRTSWIFTLTETVLHNVHKRPSGAQIPSISIWKRCVEGRLSSPGWLGVAPPTSRHLFIWQPLNQTNLH